MSETIGIVGDIHGNVQALLGLLRTIDGKYDRLIFAGDYINRGRGSADVIQILVDNASENSKMTFVAGNHDLAFLNCLEDGKLSEFLMIGGAATINSYIKAPEPDVLSQLRRSVSVEHKNFLHNLQPRYFDNGLLVTHDAENSLKPGKGVLFHAFGHVPQASFIPKITQDWAAIDTGCGTLPGGRLTCLFWPTRDFVQVDDSGHKV
ncbi:metallophosphoesterase [Umezawaea endophytica]|uniref:Metallophosphoesterase n=1 Tax=Umezawaea endophytica TaxID=1654476 RepID=A0A9X2VTM8_9PSEU|nr:metallophosphoesterase [Umezawaea endophytica]MCS7481914.1 metallophosphoesterase [Umezawaea endophytica]